MKYSTRMIIDLPLNQVVELFSDTEILHKWQAGLKSRTVIEGVSGREGCRSKLVFEGRKGDLVMTETVKECKLPDLYIVAYNSRGVYNEMKSRFMGEDRGRTIWHAENMFRFRGLMALMAPFLKAAFKSNTLLNMERFKTFAENESRS